MAQTHTWFATAADAKLIVSWLREAGAVGNNAPLPEGDCPADGREFILHFPAIGPIEYWPAEIDLSNYPEGSTRWRHATIATIQQRSHPGVPQVDADRSAVAGLRLPELRDGQHWISGCVWFPGSRLRETFPGLAVVCRRFERWIRSYPAVFNNTKPHDPSPFAYQLCMTGIVQQTVALPEAHALLEKGSFMVEHNVTPRIYAEFRRRLQLAGYLT